MKFNKRIKIYDAISMRLLGWVCFAAGGTEMVNPLLLALNNEAGMSLLVGGALLATGRASAFANIIKKGLADAD